MTVRIMTYNILDGGGDRLPLIRSVLQEQQPDVIVLQEVFDRDWVDALAARLGMDSYFARGNNIRHVALLSRLPILSVQTHRAFPIRCAVLQAEIEFGRGDIVTIFGIHLAPYPAFYHELWRTLEVRLILRLALACKNRPHLILGDCNSIASGDRVVWVESIPPFLRRMLAMQGWRVFHWALRRMLRAGYTDSFRCLHRDLDGFTLPTPRPNARLDYIFADPLMRERLTACRVVTDGDAVHAASDHYPVLAEFANAPFVAGAEKH